MKNIFAPLKKMARGYG